MRKRVVIPATTESIREHIEKKRGAMGKVEFARVVGVSRAVVDAWERGLYFPHPQQLARLGLGPCYEVLDDSPMQAGDIAPAKKSAKKAAKKSTRGSK